MSGKRDPARIPQLRRKCLMMRSLYSGIAGLKTHQTRMDVVGNNIANVNTTAFKSSTINFSDLMSQTTQNASGPNAATGTGGTNARQIGLGVKTGAITVNMDGQGSAQSTGNPFDIMITGDNFFVVSNGMSNFFTRDGSFYVDGGGNLAMTSTGYNVMGWQVNEETMEIKKDTVSALRIMSEANMTYPPEATQNATVAGILDQNDVDVQSDSGKSLNLNFYDALGYSYTAKFIIKDSDQEGLFSVELDKITDSVSGEEIKNADGSAIDFAKLFGSPASVDDASTLTFNATGTYSWPDATHFTMGNGTLNLATLMVGNDLDMNAQIPLEDPIGTAKNDDDGNPIVYTGKEAIAMIAESYGMGGDPDSFLKLLYQSGTDPDYVYSTIKDILVTQLGGTVTNAPAGITGLNDANFGTLQSNGSTAINMSGRSFEGAKMQFDPDTGAFRDINGTKTVVMKLSTLVANTDNGASNFEDVTIDFSGISMFNNNGTSTISASSGDSKGLGSGRMLGDMIGVSIQNNGMIYASYDNGMTKLLGQIATAAFANNSGLSKEGDNLYSSTMNSGEFDGIGVDVTANGGYMTTGVLEMSNVDLSNEFTTMITTQRGFQANSRIITVSDTLLEELTNLKR